MKLDINKEKIDLYESVLTYGSKKQIAKLANVSVQAVSRFFSCKGNSAKIEAATLEYIAQINKDRKRMLKKAGLL